jgi:hypothetical protein
MSSPSISVMNAGRAFSLASTFRQSYSVPQLPRDFLHQRECYTLRVIRDGLLLGPLGRRQAAAQIGERLFRNLDAEGACGLLFGRACR